MMITSYQFCWNESILMPFIYKKWKENFPGCRTILLDNHSDDDSIYKATELGYTGIYHYTTKGFSDEDNMRLSNNLPCEPMGICSITDFDEILAINQEELEEEDKKGTTIIRFEGWGMVGNGEPIEQVNMAYRLPRFDKFIMFNHDKVKMNFGAGRHECYPKGEVKYSQKVYKLLHYGTWNLEYWLNRRRMYNTRWSQKNLDMQWGYESRLPEEQLIEKYNKNKEKAIKII